MREELTHDSGVLFYRPEREWPVEPPGQPLRVPAPSAPPEPAAGGAWMALLPALGGLGVVAFAVVLGNLLFLLVGLLMVLALVGATLGMRRVTAGAAQRNWNRTRQHYLAALSVARAEAEHWAGIEADALLGTHPRPEELESAVGSRRGVWERRPHDEDFLRLRVGLGPLPAAVPVVIDPADPLTAMAADAALVRAAREVSDATAVLPCAPVTVDLVQAGSVTVLAVAQDARAIARALVVQAAVAHAPEQCRLAVLSDEEGVTAWEWMKWLPHTRSPDAGREGFARSTRMIGADPALVGSLAARLPGGSEGGERAITSGTAEPSGPVTLLVVDATGGPRAQALVRAAEVRSLQAVAGPATRIAVLTLIEDPALMPESAGLTVCADAGGVTIASSKRGTRPLAGVQPDLPSTATCRRLARRLASLRLADTGEKGAAAPALAETVSLLQLLGHEDAGGVDAAASWAGVADATGRFEPTEDLPPASSHRGDPAALLRVPIGRAADGTLLELDLKEAAAGGMGPHGLLVGATGSGKSELLRSLVLALAVRHAPELLAFVLADYKGGAAFADLADLPHVAGTVTNLADDTGRIDRMQTALRAEVSRRQETLRTAGVSSVREYHALLGTGADLPALPYLLIVVDEFAELLAARPEFAETFASLCRVGRSLGIHLLLASQRPDEGRLSLLESHLRYRICLRTQSPSESASVLGSRAAADLPFVPGLGYCAVDGRLTMFKAALSSAASRREPAAGAGIGQAPLLAPFELSRPAAQPLERLGTAAARMTGAEDGGQPVRTQLQAAIEALRRSAPGRPDPVHQVWLPPLPGSVQMTELQTAQWELPDVRATAQVPLGILDVPERAAQPVAVADFSGVGGNLAVAGGPRSGKSTLLRSVACSLALRCAPEDAQLFLLDLGGGAGLHPLIGLPHVSVYAARGDRLLALRALRELSALIATRAATYRREGLAGIDDYLRARRAGKVQDAYGEVYLLLDDVAALRRDAEDLEALVSDIASNGLAHGVHVLASTGRWFDVRSGLLDAFGQRYELRLSDVLDSMHRRQVAESVPVGVPGRALRGDGQAVQLAEPAAYEGISGGDALAGVVSAAQALWAGQRAPAVRLLPLQVTVEEVLDREGQDSVGSPTSVSSEQGGFLLGAEEFGLRPVRVPLHVPGVPLLVYGDSGSGKSALLARVLAHLDATCDRDEVRVFVVDPRRGLRAAAGASHLVDGYVPTAAAADDLARSLFQEMRGRLDAVPADLDAWATNTSLHHPAGPWCVVLVDDADLLSSAPGSPWNDVAGLLPAADIAGLTVVAARRVGGMSRSAFEPFVQRLREASTASLVLGGAPEEGPIVGKVAAVEDLPPGRGTLVRRGIRPTLVQCVTGDERERPAVPVGQWEAVTAS